MTERLTDEVSKLHGILKVCGESVCKCRCSECDFLDTAIEKLRDYENIGTVEELQKLKQWKADMIEDFCKYDVNSVDELRASVIDAFSEAIMVKATELSEKVVFDGRLVGDAVSLDCVSDMVVEIAEQMKGEKE